MDSRKFCRICGKEGVNAKTHDRGHPAPEPKLPRGRKRTLKAEAIKQEILRRYASGAGASVGEIARDLERTFTYVAKVVAGPDRSPLGGISRRSHLSLTPSQVS